MSAPVAGPDLPEVGPAPLVLNLSGGVDSTYAAWELLRHGHRLLIHHCVLKSHERRHGAESAAVAKILAWFRSHGLTQFEHVETGFDYGTLRFIVRDIEIIRFITGVILRRKAYQHIDTVVASGIAEDPVLPDSEVARIGRLLEDAARRPIRLVRPIRHMSKADIIGAMPPDLFALTWYCRRPRAGRTCGACRTCGHVKGALGA